MKTILVGYASGTSKKSNNPYWRVDLAILTTPMDNSKGIFGYAPQILFVSEQVFNSLSPDMLLKPVDVQVCGFGYHQEVISITAIK